jgi:hypothetical protein
VHMGQTFLLLREPRRFLAAFPLLSFALPASVCAAAGVVGVTVAAATRASAGDRAATAIARVVDADLGEILEKSVPVYIC